jgi:hypothetical protein
MLGTWCVCAALGSFRDLLSMSDARRNHPTPLRRMQEDSVLLARVRLESCDETGKMPVGTDPLANSLAEKRRKISLDSGTASLLKREI